MNNITQKYTCLWFHKVSKCALLGRVSVSLGLSLVLEVSVARSGIVRPWIRTSQRRRRARVVTLSKNHRGIATPVGGVVTPPLPPTPVAASADRYGYTSGCVTAIAACGDRTLPYTRHR